MPSADSENSQSEPNRLIPNSTKYVALERDAWKNYQIIIPNIEYSSARRNLDKPVGIFQNNAIDGNGSGSFFFAIFC